MKTIIAIALCFCISTCFAATWFVDSGNHTGIYTGTTWGTAWTNVTQVSGLVLAGDTVYISGGATGASRTYAVSSWSPHGGTTNSPITYQIGQDSSHNGTAIFTGSGTWLTSVQNVIISGDAGDGAMHFSLANPANNTSPYSVGVSTAAFSWGRIGYVNFGIIIWEGNLQAGGTGGPINIDHTWGYNTSTTVNAQYAWYDAQPSVAARSTFISNTVFTPYLQGNNGVGSDGINTGGAVTALNNVFWAYPVSSYASTQHGDAIQILNAESCDIENNIIYGYGDEGIFLDASFAIPMRNDKVFNNVIVATNGLPPAPILVDAQAVCGAPLTNIIVANNTCGTIGFYSEVAGNSFSFNMVANNIKLQGGYDGTSHFGGGPTEIDGYFNSTITSSNFVNSAGGNYALSANATQMIGKGTNLTSVFTTDFSGAQRQSLPRAWDIGAYLFGTNAVLPSVQNLHVQGMTSASATAN